MTCPEAIYPEFSSPGDAKSALEIFSVMVVPNPRLRTLCWIWGATEDTPRMPPDQNPNPNPCVVKLFVGWRDDRLMAAMGEKFPIPIQRITQYGQVRWIKPNG